jgi:hypothetical protein
MNLAGRDLRCTACGFVLHVPAPGEADPLSDPLGDPLAAAAALQPVARPLATMPTRSKASAWDNPALIKNLLIAGGALVGLILLWVSALIVYRSVPWTSLLAPSEIAQAPSDSEQVDAQGPSWLDPLQPTTASSTPAPASSGLDSGRMTDSSTAGSNDSQPVEADPDVSSAPEPSTSGETETLPSGLSRWHDAPSATRAGLRRVGTAGPPITHYSWMCGLLPYLGHQMLYDKFDFSKEWSDERNLELTGEIVPQFLNPSDPRERYEGYPLKGMALTHFVGMSGIEDRRTVVAASLPRSDPRAGIFGYDGVARREEITDGTSNTIKILGSGELAAPWTLGGGGTIRGAREPYFDRLSGFGSRGRSTEGTLAVMADGSVRFISSDIDPAAFRALCTIRGGETIDIGRWVEPADLGTRGAGSAVRVPTDGLTNPRMGQ